MSLWDHAPQDGAGRGSQGRGSSEHLAEPDRTLPVAPGPLFLGAD